MIPRRGNSMKVSIGKYVVVAALMSPSMALAANFALFPSTPQYSDPSQIVPNMNGFFLDLNQNGVNRLGAKSNYRNLMDNGDFAVQQRGTGAASANGSTTTITDAAYSADRWVGVMNQTSGLATTTPITSSLPPRFEGGLTVQRTAASSLHTAQICVMQEIPTQKVVGMQGQGLVLSAYLEAGANFSAANNLVTAYFMTGTSADEGIIAKGPSASNAPTIALTGLVTQSAAFDITSSWARYMAAPAFQVPTNALEAVVAFCFLPSSTAAGTTDAFYVTGVQLEQTDNPATPVASPYEFMSYADELRVAQRYLYQIAESATSGAWQSSSGGGASTTVCDLYFPFPVTMRVAPTYFSVPSPLTTSTWTITHGVTATALTTGFLAVNGAHTVNGASMTATVASGLTLGQTCGLTSANGLSTINWQADF
jgi:hypothetical protein